MFSETSCIPESFCYNNICMLEVHIIINLIYTENDGDVMFRRFMYGRYGTDKLNLAMVVLVVALSLLNSLLFAIFESSVLYSLLSSVYGVLLVFSIYRMLSRNIAARRAENQKWLNFCKRLRDRDNRYFRCPHCRQRVRVPRHKGKISIRCPKCGEKFIRKT